MQGSLLVISLDFELFWGVRDKRTIENYGANVRGVRQVIPSLVELFEKYGISATFATVGFLFSRNRNELLNFVPGEKPAYHLSKHSPYEDNYLSTVGYSEEDDIYHYAESLIKILQQSPQQEIASHTFSHYYCLEGASLVSFEQDIQAAKAIASTHGIELKSIVFPRNQYSKEHIDICKKLGLISYRGNEASKIYNPRQNNEQSKLIRATRLGDSYVNITGHHSFRPKEENGIINIPASRFLRPYFPRLKSLESLRLHRIKSSMSYAAKKGECYHLWWHPHNFGVNLKENLSLLESILKHYQMLHGEHGMQSKTMRQIAEEILQPYAV
ncbi:MAG: polysaccharide deacetylase family protein [Flavisolibacter sp.]|nr:polysaccharide deacetylase family protein [Flavisolibacter sp.]